MATQQLKATFTGGNIATNRATTLTTDLLNAFLVEIGASPYRMFTFDGYSIMGLPVASYNLGQEIRFAFGNTFVDGYNRAFGSGMVIDSYRLFGLSLI